MNTLLLAVLQDAVSPVTEHMTLFTGMLPDVDRTADISHTVEEMPEPLICSYPRSAVKMPNEVFDNGDFQFGLANYLSQSNTVDSDGLLPLPIHPQYVHQCTV